MFKKAETGLYMTAVVGVIAIFLVTMFAMGGLPWTIDGDLVGDAKGIFVLQNGINPHLSDETSSNEKGAYASDDSLFNRKGVSIERMPPKSRFSETPIKDPKRSEDDLPKMMPEEDSDSQSLVDDCVENGYLNYDTWQFPPMNPTLVQEQEWLDECVEWAESQILNDGASCEDSGNCVDTICGTGDDWYYSSSYCVLGVCEPGTC
jgi:hypothetical protein